VHLHRCRTLSSKIVQECLTCPIAIVVPLDHARDSSAANSVSVNRADSIRFRASGRLEPFATGLRSVGVSIVQPQFWKPSTNVNAVYTELRKCFIARALTFVYGRLRTSTFSGVECRDTPVRSTERAFHGCRTNCGSAIHWLPHDSCSFAGCNAGSATCAILRGAANTKALSGTSGFRSPKEFLEVAVLGEDVGQRPCPRLIGGGVEKGCIPGRSARRWFRRGESTR